MWSLFLLSRDFDCHEIYPIREQILQAFPTLTSASRLRMVNASEKSGLECGMHPEDQQNKVWHKHSLYNSSLRIIVQTRLKFEFEKKRWSFWPADGRIADLQKQNKVLLINFIDILLPFVFEAKEILAAKDMQKTNKIVRNNQFPQTTPYGIQIIKFNYPHGSIEKSSYRARGNYLNECRKPYNDVRRVHFYDRLINCLVL